SGSWRRSQTARRLKRASGTSTKRWRRCGPERLRKAPPHSWGGGGGAAGGAGGAGSADQRLQRLFGSPPQLSSEKYPDDAAPPPGREVEVSIEPDQRPAFLGLGQRHVLLVGDPKWQVDHQVSPSVLRVDVAHVDPHRPLSAEAARRQVDHQVSWSRSGA